MPPPTSLPVQRSKPWESPDSPQLFTAHKAGASKSPGVMTHIDAAARIHTPPPLSSTPVSSWSIPPSTPTTTGTAGGRNSTPSHNLPPPPSSLFSSNINKEQQQGADVAGWFMSLPNVNATSGFRTTTTTTTHNNSVWGHATATPPSLTAAVDNESSNGNNAATSSPTTTSSTRADSPSFSVSSSSSTTESVRTNEFLNPHAPAFVPSGPTGLGTRPSIYEFATKKAEEARLKAIKILQESLSTVARDTVVEDTAAATASPAAITFKEDATQYYSYHASYEAVDGYDPNNTGVMGQRGDHDYSPWFYVFRECTSMIRLQPAVARENLHTYAHSLVNSQPYQWSVDEMAELSLQICWTGLEAGQPQGQEEEDEVSMMAMFTTEIYHAFLAIGGDQWAQEFIVRFKDCVMGLFRNHWVSNNTTPIPYRLGLCIFMGYLSSYSILPSQSIGICLLLLLENTLSSPHPIYGIRRLVNISGPELWIKDEQGIGMIFAVKGAPLPVGGHEQRVRGWLNMLRKKGGAIVKAKHTNSSPNANNAAAAEVEHDVDGSSLEQVIEEVVGNVLAWSQSHGQGNANGPVDQHQHHQHLQLPQPPPVYRTVPGSGTPSFSNRNVGRYFSGL